MSSAKGRPRCLEVSDEAALNVNRPGFTEARWLESGRRGLLLKKAILVGLELGRRHVAQRCHRALAVESGHSMQRGQFNRLLGLPGTSAVDQFSFVQTVDRLGQGVVVGVALTANRRLDAGLGQPFGVADADVLGGFNGSSQHRVTRRILGSPP